MMFKVLVLFAMLSSADGWGLPSDDSLLESNEFTNIMGGVDGAREGRQLHGCSCDRSCNQGCDGGLFGGCDHSCDKGCDGRRLATGCQDQIATASGLPRCPAPVLSSALA